MKQHSTGTVGVRANRNMETMEHVPFSKNETLVGTSRYASVNSHTGVRLLHQTPANSAAQTHSKQTGQSRRDDVEAVGYVLLFMLNGTLPWADTLGKASATTNQSKEQRVYAIKSTMPVPQICDGAPSLCHPTNTNNKHKQQAQTTQQRSLWSTSSTAAALRTTQRPTTASCARCCSRRLTTSTWCGTLNTTGWCNEPFVAASARLVWVILNVRGVVCVLYKKKQKASQERV